MSEPGCTALWDSLSSTQELALKTLEACSLNETGIPRVVVAAKTQTKGRGREERPWHSPAGGYYVSLILPLENTCLPALPLKTGIHLRNFLEELYGVHVNVRWPNDLLVSGRKIAGILVDVRRETPVIGMGINLSVPSDELEAVGLSEATSLEDLSPHRESFDSFHKKFLYEFLPTLQPALTREFDPALWDSVSAFTPGTPIRWRERENRLQGIYRGVDERGFLLAEREGALSPVYSASRVREIKP